ncbi:MAG: hypothetical protein JRJ45_12780 [Deltaproteobacteria bacterium]|nr:hypothetical protein [Deltaproteobacteria bacterium]
MKARKIILMAVMVLFGLAVILPGIANAAAQTYECDVVQARYNDAGGVTIILTRDEGTTSRPFVAPAGRENGMLAIALTAISLDMKVYVRVEWATGMSEIIYMGLASAYKL